MANPTISQIVKADVDLLVPEVISKEIEFRSENEGFRRFQEFVVQKTELEKGPGETIQVTKIERLGRAQTGGEGKVLQGSGKGLNLASVSITPTEFMDEIQISEYSQITSQEDLQDLSIELLTEQSVKEFNLDIRDTFAGGTNIRYAGGAATQAATTAEVDNDDFDFVEEELATDQAAMFNRTNYVCFIHPRSRGALRGSLVSIGDYGNAVPRLFEGEIGMYNRTRFIETPDAPKFATVASSTVTTGASGTFDETGGNVTVVEQSIKPGDYTLTFTSATAYDATDPSGKALGSGDVSSQFQSDYLGENFPAGLLTVESAAFGGTYQADDTVDITIDVYYAAVVLGMRAVALAISKPPTMLGAEAIDYGRTAAIGWNGFWASADLNSDYWWLVVGKHQ